MHQNALKSFLIVCATLFFVFAFSIAYKFVSNSASLNTFPINNSANDNEISYEDDSDPNPAYIGILRQTGLNGIVSEKTRLHLSVSDYELTHFVKEGSETKDDFQLMFIEDTHFDYKGFVGKCVRAKVAFLDYPNYISRDAYMGVPVNVSSLSLVKNQAICSPYYGSGEPTNATYVTLSGLLKRFERPAPDIDYDYTLALDEPYLDENNATGLNMYVKNYVVIPSTSALWLKLEDNIDKHVTLDGYFSWGFAESKYFTVTGITQSQKQ